MDNRSLELCLLYNIGTVQEFAEKVDIPKEEAIALINKDESVRVSELTISKCLKFFNCTFDYFFCFTE